MRVTISVLAGRRERSESSDHIGPRLRRLSPNRDAISSHGEWPSRRMAYGVQSSGSCPHLSPPSVESSDERHIQNDRSHLLHTASRHLHGNRHPESSCSSSTVSRIIRAGSASCATVIRLVVSSSTSSSRQTSHRVGNQRCPIVAATRSGIERRLASSPAVTAARFVRPNSCRDI